MSLGTRAFLAIVLLVGFYVIGLGIAAALVSLPILEVVFLGRLHLQIALIGLVTGGIIFWSLLPRRDRFEAPGPLLHRESHPRLYAELDRIARSLGEQVPQEVYLVPDINAFVATRGGFMGIGGRRVMGVGLALMQVLSVKQFRAVLAHEYGHYQEGDTALGPMVFSTRQTIIRTVENLGDNIVNVILINYLKLFLRVSGGVSRSQELVADRVSARVAGRANTRDGLRITHTVAAAYEPYLHGELYPSLNAGGLPPVADGFRRFLAAEPIRAALAKQEAELDRAARAAEQYDSHPSLHERLAALDALPDSAPLVDGDEGPALDLLSDLPRLERDLIGHNVGEDKLRTLKTTDWERVGTEIFMPYWRMLMERHRDGLGTVPLADWPGLPGNQDFARRLQRSNAALESEADLKGFSDFLFGIGLCLALEAAGWEIATPPGLPIEARRDGQLVQPMVAVQAMTEKTATPAEWQAQAEAWGVAGWTAVGVG